MTERIELSASFIPFLQRIRKTKPRIHCLTNSVVQNMTANFLLAIGAVPSMTANPVEVADFTAGANALLINLGTLDPTRQHAMEQAITCANNNNIPWILDPVLADRSQHRLEYAKKLITKSPTAIRGNYQEISALRENNPLEKQTQPIWISSGAIDKIDDQGQIIENHSGHIFMDRVTGMGCAGTAIIAAFLACRGEEATCDALSAGLDFIGTVGEQASLYMRGPGSFEISFIDHLYMISDKAVRDLKNDV